MRPSVKAVSLLLFSIIMLMYSALSSADDPLMIIQLMIERGRSTGGVGAEDPQVERAQKIHWWSRRRQSTSGQGAENPLVDQVQIMSCIGLYNSRCLKELNVKCRSNF